MRKFLLVILLLMGFNTAFGIHARYFKEIQSQRSTQMGYNYLDLSGLKQVDKEDLNKNYCYMFIYDDEDDRLIKIHYIQNGRITAIPLKDYSTISLEYKDGYEVRTYSNPVGHSVPNEWGIWKIRTKLDENGRYLKSFNYNKKDRLDHDKNGVCIYGFEYDDRWRLIHIRSLNSRGKKVEINGYSAISFSYDESDGTVTKTYLNKEERPVPNAFGVTHEKVLSVQTNGIAVHQFSYFNKDFKRILHKQIQAHTVIKIVNDYKRTLETRYYDQKDQLITKGIAIQKIKLDENGHVKSIAYFDHGEKALQIQGIHEKKYQNDPFGNVLQMSHLTARGDLVPLQGQISMIRYRYNTWGDIVFKQYYGIDEQPTLDEQGISVVRFKYNDRGQETEVAYYDLENNLIEDRNGFAVYKKRYDVQGRLVAYKRYGLDGELKPDKDGTVLITVRYHQDGRIKYFHYDANGKMIDSYWEK